MSATLRSFGVRLSHVLTGILLMMTVGLWGPAAHAQIYVDANASGNNDGTSWGNAYTNLQTAIDNATGSEEIWIAEGRYVPGSSQNDRFEISGDQNGLKIYGGFASGDTFEDRSPGDHPTVLSGDIDGDDATNAGGITETAADISGDNSHHVVVFNAGTLIGDDVSDNITSETVLNGVTITGGQANGSDNLDQIGGGLFCDGGESGNECSPSITRVVFVGNTAERFGGAMVNDGAPRGTSSPQITNAVFTGNQAGDGGGVMINNGTANGTSSPQIINATFTGNSTGGDGGAIFNNGGFGTSSPEFVNTILWDNTASGDGDEIFNSGASATLAHTLIEGGVNGSGVGGDANTDGDNNLDADPQFADAQNPAGEDAAFGTDEDGLRPVQGSPALNAGNNDALPGGISTDLLGENRIQSGTVSLGAYERGLFEGPVFHVNADATGFGNGSSFADAFTGLQEALDTATSDDVIVIAEGVYTPDNTDENVSFEITGEQNGIAIYGGWSEGKTLNTKNDVQEALDSRDLETHTTVFSGDIAGDDNTNANGVTETAGDINGANSRHVLFFDGTGTDNVTTSTVIDGVTITGGQAGDGDGTADPVVDNGGGLYCHGEGSSNECSPTLSRVRFVGNTAEEEGGALYNNGNSGMSSPQITTATFRGNTAGSLGGAIANLGSGSGGTSSPTIVGSTFTGNSAGLVGGAIYNGGSGGTSNPEITNTILWNNTASGGEEIFNDDATAALSYTLIEGGVNGGGVGGNANTDDGNNIDADPQFADAGAGNVRLTAGSPALARGTFAPFASGGVATDLAGEDRRFGLAPDLGAYEFSTIATTNDAITDASNLVGYVEPTGFDGLLLLRENSASTGGLTFTRTNEAPNSPDLPDNVAPVTWEVDSDLSDTPTYDLVLDVSSIPGIGAFNELMLYKSDNGGSTWNAVNTFSGARLVLDEARALVAVQDLTGFSQFAIASGDAGNPLPVELARFDAQHADDDAIMVQWRTLSETNNAGFAVQRSTAGTGSANESVETPQVETPQWDVSTGESWQTITRLDGAGTTDTPQSYRFEDTDLPYAADSLRYRLRQVDTDGTESFSEAVTIARPVVEAELLPTHPNPTRGAATVRFAVPERQDVRIVLYDMLGRRIRTVVDTNAAGRTEAQLDVSNLASGTYFLRMQTEGHTETQRITVVR